MSKEFNTLFIGGGRVGAQNESLYGCRDDSCCSICLYDSVRRIDGREFDCPQYLVGAKAHLRRRFGKHKVINVGKGFLVLEQKEH